MVNGKFLTVTCPRCKNQKIVFGKASLRIKCLKCNYLLLTPKGGKAKVRAPIRKIHLEI